MAAAAPERRPPFPKSVSELPAPTLEPRAVLLDAGTESAAPATPKPQSLPPPLPTISRERAAAVPPSDSQDCDDLRALLQSPLRLRLQAAVQQARMFSQRISLPGSRELHRGACIAVLAGLFGWWLGHSSSTPSPARLVSLAPVLVESASRLHRAAEEVHCPPRAEPASGIESAAQAKDSARQKKPGRGALTQRGLRPSARSQ